ncbi:SDR family NAD(P)-dependent oxidoreductase [Amycolatopsis alkalitolerans]|uniref:SDR family NAD(P)-dependent oxidoreductase n=1 Tax=Amycolatopsis alkalitolerans TaxID=2547244 RepID=A0A5C4M1W5_9PSEU|nr:SDR family NAD(P)-dependent oxidoreductase [Amycolatopsis alkalitolerans]TNC26878.1 SDR family NAD(P)-dependent oxidoreductase [Amycolatopsis alkalitolerans]
MRELGGKVAVITGTGSGMGRAFAYRFAAEGMKVVAADIDEAALGETVAGIRAAGGEAAGVPTDVSDPAAVRRLAAEATAKYGPVHLLCNNAGVEGYLDGAIWEAGDKDWTWTVDVNFWSVVHGVRTFVPLMLEHGEDAHVVNTASMTAVITPGNMYGITKHAVLALTEVLGADLAARRANIGVTALCPGTIATNLFHGSRNRPARLRTETGQSATGKELRERMHATLAEGMSPDEVAAKLADAVRSGAPYLLTDHDWDERIIARHEAILGGAVDAVEVAR